VQDLEIILLEILQLLHVHQDHKVKAEDNVPEKIDRQEVDRQVLQQEVEIWQDLVQVLFVQDLLRVHNNEVMEQLLVRKIATLHLHIAAKVAQVRDQVEQLALLQDQEQENQVAVLRQEDQDSEEVLAEHLEKMLERKRITNQRRLVAKR
jgi:hypothetical protein